MSLYPETFDWLAAEFAPQCDIPFVESNGCARDFLANVNAPNSGESSVLVSIQNISEAIQQADDHLTKVSLACGQIGCSKIFEVESTGSGDVVAPHSYGDCNNLPQKS